MFDPANPQPGIYPNLPEQVYRSAQGISQTEIKEVEVSPAHFAARKFGKAKEPTDAQVVGTLTHALVLQNRQLFCVVPEDAPRKPTQAQINAKKPSDETLAAIQWWKTYEFNTRGKTPVSKEQADHLFEMQAAVLRHPIANSILRRATLASAEVAAFKKHEETGLMMKGLADLVVHDDDNFMVLPDLKTTPAGGASSKEFSKSIFNWGYHRQAAWYLDLFGATHFMFIAVEKEPPYAVAVYKLQTDAIEMGRRANERDLRILKKCFDENKWPGYSEEIEFIGLPEWAKKRE